jgi:uncharacterized membrane protein
MKNNYQKLLNLSSLFLWLVIGTILRFARLGVLPPWTDECATIVFSLGNSFYNIPVNKLLTIHDLLEPFVPNPTAGINQVIHYLFGESTHPPVYFVLTHWWLKLFPLEDGIVSVWAARSLSAILGVLSIPAIFFLARRIFPSSLVAQLAAAMMAVSPLGIFLAQQARHYTLCILLVIASLYCFLQAFKHICRRQSISSKLALFWVAINSLGIAAHYFFFLGLLAQFTVISYLAWQQYKKNKSALLYPNWRRIYGVILGSVVGCLVWLPALQNVQGSDLTDWIYESNPTSRWIEPVARFVLWILSMFILLPSSPYDLPVGVIIVSGIITLSLLILFIPNLISGIKLEIKDENNILGIQGLLGYCIAIIALFLAATYIFSLDLTLAPRFYFIFFPAVIILLALSLAGLWENSFQNRSQLSNKTIVIFIWLIALSGGIAAVFNLGYLQSHRPDIFIATLKKNSENPAVIAIPFKHHGHTGRMTAIAWGLKDLPEGEKTKFFLVHQNIEKESYDQTILTLENLRKELNHPLDLWLVNFRSQGEIKSETCKRENLEKKSAGQYDYKLYRCG